MIISKPPFYISPQTDKFTTVEICLPLFSVLLWNDNLRLSSQRWKNFNYDSDVMLYYSLLTFWGNAVSNVHNLWELQIGKHKTLMTVDTLEGSFALPYVLATFSRWELSVLFWTCDPKWHAERKTKNQPEYTRVIRVQVFDIHTYMTVTWMATVTANIFKVHQKTLRKSSKIAVLHGWYMTSKIICPWHIARHTACWHYLFHSSNHKLRFEVSHSD